jgi:MFS family permease
MLTYAHDFLRWGGYACRLYGPCTRVILAVADGDPPSLFFLLCQQSCNFNFHAPDTTCRTSTFMMSISKMTDDESSPVTEESHLLNHAPTLGSSSTPLTIFSPATRKSITYQASFSAMFSGLSSFIYYPALKPLAEALHVSITAINPTVSAYLIVAGIFPSVIGDISNQTGRRPASILAFTLYFSANLGLALQNNYAALVFLRCLQSAGAAGTIAIAYGVITDITTPAERGSYVGVLLGFTNSAPCLGPILGGVIAQKLSWRWIFWLLTLLSGSHLLGLLAFFPETSRKLVGNGALSPRSRLNWTLYSIVMKRENTVKRSTADPKMTRIPNPLACLKLLFQKPTFIIITVGSIQYAIYSVLGTSIATEMAQLYSLDILTAGLLYLPAGVGGLMAALLTGKLVDYDYRVVARSLHLSSPELATSRSPNDLLAFPVEKARLRSIFPFLAIASIATVGYGWSLYAHAHIAVPLVLQFLSGSTQVAMFVICGTLLTDYNPDQSATAQASYNIVRCALAAVCVAVLEPLIGGVGIGQCFTIYSGIGLLCFPLLLVLRSQGWAWRQKAERSRVRVVSYIHGRCIISTYNMSWCFPQYHDWKISPKMFSEAFCYQFTYYSSRDPRPRVMGTLK